MLELPTSRAMLATARLLLILVSIPLRAQEHDAGGQDSFGKAVTRRGMPWDNSDQYDRI